VPIYEFYCADCHTIYSFFSKRINTQKKPRCPACQKPDLDRQVSLFSVSKGRTDQDATFDGMDEERMESALMAMAGEFEHLDEDDPRQAAGMMRKLFDSAGMRMGEAMDEAIRRMESGDDPEEIESELGDRIEEEDPFSLKPQRAISDLRRRYLPPRVDPKLYDL
jgi:putative FmdB family regulatory protein